MSLNKYYPPESFDFICVNDGLSVRFSQSEILNDPFELNTVFTKLDPLLKKMIKHIQKDESKSEQTIKNIEGRDRSKFNEITNTSMSKDIGILSLTKNDESRPMWAYYAKEHTGFMVQISDKFLHTLEPNEAYDIFKDINYSTKRPKNVDIYESFNEVYYTKDNAWEHEREFRVIQELEDIPLYTTDTNGVNVHCSIIPEEYIIKIVLGSRSSEELKEKAKFWIKNNKNSIELYKAETCQTNYQLIYKKVEM